MLSKVITIAQQKGGTGKTTLSVHLALAFIKYHNLKVAIIDNGTIEKIIICKLLIPSEYCGNNSFIKNGEIKNTIKAIIKELKITR